MTVFYLIRHGENDLLGRRLPGWMPGVHLNARGQAQAERIARGLAKARIRAVYASPLERTMETARPLAKALKLKVVARQALGEVRPGSWQGQPLKSLRRRKLWPVIQSTPSLARFPGGESIVEAQARVVGELEALRGRHPREAIACFSHADVIKMAVAHYLGLPLDMYQRLSIAPASISVLSIEHGRIRLLALNDCSHAG